MSEQFIARTTVRRDVLRRVGETSLVERHADLVRIAREAGGDPDLFATPIPGRPKDDGTLNVSWYTTRSGTPHRFDGLDGALREDVALRLEEELDPLRAHLDAPEISQEDKAVLREALCIADAASIHTVGGHPLLTGWGIGTEELGPEPEAAARHFDTVLRGLGLRPLIGAAAEAPAGETHASEPAPEAGDLAAAAEAVTQDAVPLSDDRATEDAPLAPVARTGWWPVWALAGLCALLAVLLLLLLLAPERFGWLGSGTGAAPVDAALAARARALETALNGAVCTEEGQFVLPDETEPGLLPAQPRLEGPSLPGAETAR